MKQTINERVNGRTNGAVASKSERLLERARQSIAGGDNSTMRVLPYHLPLVAVRGEGCRVWDVDGQEYIDLNMAYGPLIFGHRPPAVIDAVVRQITESGSQLGFPAEVSVRVAEKVKQLFPHIELLRFSSTGTEAIVAASATGADLHRREVHHRVRGSLSRLERQHFQPLSRPARQLPDGPYGPAMPGTLGMNGAPHDVLVCRWNSPEALEQCLADHAGQVAAVIMEPVMGNGGVIPPQPGFLEVARALTTDHDALVDLRRSDHGHASGRRAAPSSDTASKPTSRSSARHWAAVFRSRPWAAPAKSCSRSSKDACSTAGSTRATRWSWRPPTPCSTRCCDNGEAIYQHLEDISAELGRGRRRNSYPAGHSASGTIRGPDDFDAADARRLRSADQLSRRAAELRL